MKKLLLISLVLGAISQAWALPSFDSFADVTASGGTSYLVGSDLLGQTNSVGGRWNGLGTNATFSPIRPVIAEGNLSFSGLPASVGNSVAVAPANGGGARLNLNVAAGTAGTYYYSFLLKVTDISAVPTTAANNPIAAFSDDPNEQGAQLGRMGSRVVTKAVGSGYVLGISKSANTSDFVYEATPHNVGDVVFVVGSYEWFPGVSTNVNMWINPSPTTFGIDTPPAPTISALSGNTALNGNGARAFAILCQFVTAPSAIIDELRVGTNWSYVAPLGDPAILQNPANQTIPPGANATFSVTASGTATLTYQWLKDGTTVLADGGNISGANTATLHVNNVGLSDVGAYSVVVSNGLGNSAQSSGASLVLSDPAITTQPQSRTNDFGTTATFSVVVSGTAPFNYQWHKEGAGDLSDGGNISGSQTATLTLTGVSGTDAGNYYVTIGNSKGSVDSANALLTVNDPAITQQPVSSTNRPGETVVFHVAATGSGSLSYQWRKDGNYIFDVGNFSGTSTDTLTITGITAENEGKYSVAVVGASIVNSDEAVLTVLSPVSITTEPTPRTVAVGSPVSFAVRASGADPLNYQWFQGGTLVPGATSSVYTISNAQLSASGNYTVVVSNIINSVTSAPAVLNVSTNLQLFETNLVVVRVGDVAQTLTPTGNSIFLDQFDVNGNYVNTVTIPDDGASGMVAIGWDNINGVNSGTTTGTSLTRSLDGRFLVVAGYNTNRNFGANLNTSVAASVPRGIGLINSHAQYNLAVASTNSVFDNTYWRAAVTDGTNNFWGVGGVAGTFYFGFDSESVLVQNTFINSRSMGLFNGDIYCATAANPTGVLKMNGMPTNPVTPTVLFNASSGTYDISVSPNGNLIYVCDQRNVLNGGGVQRYDFDGSNWTLTYTITSGFANVGPRYIAVDFSGPNPVIYVTSNDLSFDNNRIVKIEDIGASSVGTTIAFAGMNQTFRGIHFGPVASAPIVTSPTLSFAREGNNLVLTWPAPFVLQSSTNVAGPYVDVSGVSSPFTNALNSAAQNFFRLHQ